LNSPPIEAFGGRGDKEWRFLGEIYIKKLFVIRMKELRKNRGLSQEELAEKTDIKSKYLNRVEMVQHFSINGCPYKTC
jgi:ribosome-binding protein aMBF1 (putative translation factor)